MKSKIDDLIGRVEELLKQDIRHEKLGTQYGFHELNDLKDQTFSFILNILRNAKQFWEYIDETLMNHGLDVIGQLLDRYVADIKRVDELVKQGVEHRDFNNSRQQFIKKLQNFNLEKKKELGYLETALRISRLEETPEKIKVFRDIINYSNEEYSKLKQFSDQAKDIVDDLRDKVHSEGVDLAAETFTKLRENHEKRESKWFKYFIFFSTVTVLAVLYAVLADYNTDNVPSLIVCIFRKLLIISTTAIFMKLCLSKYNLERNLRIIYDHRNTILRQYTFFEKSISPDERDAKNQFRLEMAKFLFIDPETGYLQRGTGSEININPILSTFERFTK